MNDFLCFIRDTLTNTPRPARIRDRAEEDEEIQGRPVSVPSLCPPPPPPPKSHHIAPWEYDRQMYRQRNEVERLFRRLQGFRSIFSHFEQRDAPSLGFVVARITNALHNVNVLGVVLEYLLVCTVFYNPEETTNCPPPAISPTKHRYATSSLRVTFFCGRRSW